MLRLQQMARISQWPDVSLLFFRKWWNGHMTSRGIVVQLRSQNLVELWSISRRHAGEQNFLVWFSSDLLWCLDSSGHP